MDPKAKTVEAVSDGVHFSVRLLYKYIQRCFCRLGSNLMHIVGLGEPRSRCIACWLVQTDACLSAPGFVRQARNFYRIARQHVWHSRGNGAHTLSERPAPGV